MWLKPIAISYVSFTYAFATTPIRVRPLLFLLRGSDAHAKGNRAQPRDLCISSFYLPSLHMFLYSVRSFYGLYVPLLNVDNTCQTTALWITNKVGDVSLTVCNSILCGLLSCHLVDCFKCSARHCCSAACFGMTACTTPFSLLVYVINISV